MKRTIPTITNLPRSMLEKIVSHKSNIYNNERGLVFGSDRKKCYISIEVSDNMYVVVLQYSDITKTIQLCRDLLLLMLQANILFV